MGSSVQVVERTTVPESPTRQLASSTMLTRLLILVCFLVVPCPSIPAPQTSEADYGDDYGDYDASVKGPASSPSDGLADLLKMGAGIAQGLMAIFNNKELQDAVGTTVGAGVNLTGQLTRAAVPVAQGIVGAVPTWSGREVGLWGASSEPPMTLHLSSLMASQSSLTNFRLSLALPLPMQRSTLSRPRRLSKHSRGP